MVTTWHDDPSQRMYTTDIIAGTGKHMDTRAIPYYMRCSLGVINPPWVHCLIAKRVVRIASEFPGVVQYLTCSSLDDPTHPWHRSPLRLSPSPFPAHHPVPGNLKVYSLPSPFRVPFICYHTHHVIFSERKLQRSPSVENSGLCRSCLLTRHDAHTFLFVSDRVGSIFAIIDGLEENSMTFYAATPNLGSHGEFFMARDSSDMMIIEKWRRGL